MNQTILALCEQQQWDAIFQALSDLTFLAPVSKKDIPSLTEAIRHSLYLAEIPLQKDLKWKHPCGEMLGRGYLLRLSDILWSYSASYDASLIFRLYAGVVAEYPALAKHWASQHKEPWLRCLDVSPPAQASRWRVAGVAPVISPDNLKALLKSKGKLALIDIESSRELKTFTAAYDSHGRFSPDSRYLVTWYQKTAHLWDAASLSPIATFGPHHSDLFLVEFSPNLASVLLCSEKEISLWTLPRQMDTPVRARISRRQQSLPPRRATGMTAGSICTTGIVKPPIEYDLQCAEFLSEEFLLLRNTGSRLYVWNWKTNEILWSYKAKDHLLGVPIVNARRDRLLLIDGEFTCGFEMPSGKELFSVKLPEGPNNSAQFHPTKELAIVAARSPSAHLINTSDGEVISSINCSHAWKGFVASPTTSWSPLSIQDAQGKASEPRERLWLHSRLGIHLFDLEGKERAHFSSPSTGGFDEYPVFSADGRYLFLQRWGEQTTALYDLKPQMDTAVSATLRTGMTEVAVAPVQGVFDADSGAHLREAQKPEMETAVSSQAPRTGMTERPAALEYGARVTSDGNHILYWQEGAFSLFSLKEERSVKTIFDRAQAYFDEGRLLLARVKEGGFRVYETQTGALLCTLPGAPEDPEQWYASENKFLLLGGKTLLTSDGEHTRRWNIDTGEPLYQIKGQLSQYHGKVTKGEHFLVLTPGEKGANKSIRSLATGEEVGFFTGDKAAVLSSDGRWLAIYQGYYEVLVYEVATGALRYTFKDSSSISRAQFSDDNQFIYTWRSGELIDITDVPEDVASEWSLTTGEKTSSDKSFPSRPPAPFIEGWSWGYKQLKGPDKKLLVLPHDIMLYHMVDGRHYLAGATGGVFFVYEVCGV